MNGQPRVCVVGSSNIDLISYVPRLPKLGETLHGSRFQLGYGGKGANQAVMAAKLGAQVTMVTRLGRDVFGTGYLDNYRETGVDTTFVLFDDETFSGVAPIAVDSEGNNAIIIVGGANDKLSPVDVAAAGDAIAAAGVLVCQLEVPLETTQAALQAARDAGVTTIFNPAPAPPDLPDALLALSDVFCPNETETELLTGMEVETLEQAEAAARTLLARGPRAVVLTLGARGALLVTAEETAHLPAPQVQPLDTTGAGDAFVGSLAFFLAGGHDLKTAISRANRIAAVSVQGSGTQTSFPSRAELPDDLFYL